MLSAREAPIRRAPALKEDRTAERVTISMPAVLADYVRERAEQLKETVSGFVTDTLSDRMVRELEMEMMEGLLEDADRDRQLVREWDATLPETPPA